MQSAIRTLTAVAVLVGGGAACQTTPTLAGAGVETETDQALELIGPVDIAVVPIEVGPGAPETPAELVRTSAARALVLRRYSPLATDIVDEAIAASANRQGRAGTQEASFPVGTLGEDAILHVEVERWDNPDWEALRSIDVAINARLTNPANPDQVLWEARLDREFRFSLESGTASSSDRDFREACDTILAALITTLPARPLQSDIGDALMGQ